MSPTQSLQIIGFSKEASFGTFTSPTKFVPGTCTINDTNTVTAPAQSRGTRSQVIDVVTQHAVSVQISAELIPEVISQLIAGWFGAGSDVQTGSSGVGFTHTLTPQSTLPSFTIELDNDIFTKIIARQTVGNLIDQVTLTYQAAQITTAQFQTVGQREITPATPGTPSNPTPAITTLQPMDFSLLAVALAPGGGADTELISATLTLANQSQPIQSSNGQLYVNRIQPTQRKVTFSTTLDFLDTNLAQYWFGSFGATPQYSSVLGSMQLTLTSKANITGASNPWVVQFTLPNMRAQDQYSINSASDALQQQLTWSVTQGAQSNEINAVIVNSENGVLA